MTLCCMGQVVGSQACEPDTGVAPLSTIDPGEQELVAEADAGARKQARDNGQVKALDEEHHASTASAVPSVSTCAAVVLQSVGHVATVECMQCPFDVHAGAVFPFAPDALESLRVDRPAGACRVAAACSRALYALALHVHPRAELGLATVSSTCFSKVVHAAVAGLSSCNSTVTHASATFLVAYWTSRGLAAKAVAPNKCSDAYNTPASGAGPHPLAPSADCGNAGADCGTGGVAAGAARALGRASGGSATTIASCVAGLALHWPEFRVHALRAGVLELLFQQLEGLDGEGAHHDDSARAAVLFAIAEVIRQPAGGGRSLHVPSAEWVTAVKKHVPVDGIRVVACCLASRNPCVCAAAVDVVVRLAAGHGSQLVFHRAVEYLEAMLHVARMPALKGFAALAQPLHCFRIASKKQLMGTVELALVSETTSVAEMHWVVDLAAHLCQLCIKAQTAFAKHADVFLRLLNCVDARVAERAARVLQGVSRDPTAVRILLARGCVPRLVAALHRFQSSPSVMACIITVLTQLDTWAGMDQVMARNRKLRCMVLQLSHKLCPAKDLRVKALQLAGVMFPEQGAPRRTDLSSPASRPALVTARVAGVFAGGGTSWPCSGHCGRLHLQQDEAVRAAWIGSARPVSGPLECVICMDATTSGGIQLHCGHCFHSGCVVRVRDIRCPLCRSLPPLYANMKLSE
jgi:hypothetical protein